MGNLWNFQESAEFPRISKNLHNFQESTEIPRIYRNSKNLLSSQNLQNFLEFPDFPRVCRITNRSAEVLQKIFDCPDAYLEISKFRKKSWNSKRFSKIPAFRIISNNFQFPEVFPRINKLVALFWKFQTFQILRIKFQCTLL